MQINSTGTYNMQQHHGKVIKLSAFGGYEKLEVCDEKCNFFQPTSHQVSVQMKACGMNFSDLYTRMGLFTFKNMKPPFIMGTEGAGIVIEVGDDVVDLKVGDHVVCWSFTYGMWAENVILPDNQCHLIPQNMNFEVAASIPINYITAYYAVLDFGNLRPEQSILIQAAAGGVGIAATQLAKTVEDVTVFGTASSSKHETIKKIGVTHCIDYHTFDFVDEVKRIAPSGVNVILDSLSGNDFVRSQEILKPMGRIIHVGASKMITGEKISWWATLKVWWQMKNIPILNLVHKNYAVCGLNIANLFEDNPQSFRCALGKIMDLYSEGKIKPHIDCVLPFEQIAQATDHMLQRRNIGKIVLVPQLETKE